MPDPGPSPGAARIAPSILNADVGELAANLAALESAGVEVLHLDVMDGNFVPVLTFGAPMAAAISKRSPLLVEAHLMVSRPADLIEAFAAAGCQRLVIHPEADVHCHRTLQAIRAAGMQAGVALNPGTPPTCLPHLLELLDLVLVMTVNPGWGGQSFLADQLPKLGQVAELIRSSGRDIRLQVDGGMNPETIARCRQAGADLFVAGTAVFRHPGGIAAAVHELGGAAA